MVPFSSFPFDAAGVDNYAHPVFMTFYRVPTSQDIYPPGTQVMYDAGSSKSLYETTGGGNWIQLADADGPIQNVLGTANQITSTVSSGVATLSLPSAITAPGSLTTTTTLTGGTGVTATTGNISATVGAVSAATTVTGGTGVTATTGNITATAGNFVFTAEGSKEIHSSVGTTTAAGANSMGSVTLVGGTATVATTSVTASSLIRLTRLGVGATGAAALGILTVGTIVASTSFDINAVQPADATALQASDVSVVMWEIIN